MSINYAPRYLLAPPPCRRPPRGVPEKALLGLVAALLAVLAALGGVLHVADTRSATRLDAALRSAAQDLLPGGQVGGVDLVDGPALLAERRPLVREARVNGRTRDGRPVRVVIGDYDRARRVAHTVSWRVTGLPLAPGWRVVDGTTPYLSQVERDVDGHRVQLTATASVQGDTVLVVPGRLTVDGAAADLAELPPAVRAAVEPVSAPQRVAVPVPGTAISVRYVWFDATGLGVELRAQDVPTGGRR